MSVSAEHVCRQANINDVADVARIHLAAFPGFFLSTLGFRFLCVMYRAFMLNKASVFVVSQNSEGHLTGFAVGALQTGDRDRLLALKFLPQFVLAVLPALLRHPLVVVRRLIARFFEVGELPSISESAVMLRSIGVMPEARGGGAAALLLESFEQLAFERGAEQVCLTTDEEENERAQRFYQRHGYVMSSRFCQDGKRWMWLMNKLNLDKSQ